MTSIGRLFAVIVAAGLVIGTAVLLFFQSSIAPEGLYRVRTAIGMEATAPERHIVPAGFLGWAVVHYGVEGAPPLREDHGAVILEYPPTGRLDTSSPPPADLGLIQRGYYYRTTDGIAPIPRLGGIWGEYSHRYGGGDANPQIFYSAGFFVGTMQGFLATECPVEHRRPVGAHE
jgi:hypothetical protein